MPIPAAAAEALAALLGPRFSTAEAERALHAGLLISVTADSVIRLVPPLILSEKEADEIVAILVPLIEAFLKE